jgi:hypothetical protein
MQGAAQCVERHRTTFGLLEHLEHLFGGGIGADEIVMGTGQQCRAGLLQRGSLLQSAEFGRGPLQILLKTHQDVQPIDVQHARVIGDIEMVEELLRRRKLIELVEQLLQGCGHGHLALIALLGQPCCSPPS